MRIRGNAFQVHEKYLALARDAASAGDRVAAENYYQHAEHYFRIYSADQEERAQRQGGNGQMPDQQRRHAGNGSAQPQAHNAGQGEGRAEMNGTNGEEPSTPLAPDSGIEVTGADADGNEEAASANPEGGGQRRAPARRPQRRRRPASSE